MATFSNGEGGASVRTKINAAITVVDGLGSGDNLLMTAAERAKVGHITVTGAIDLDAVAAQLAGLTAAVVLVGEWDASAGTFPGAGSASAGQTWIVSVAGTVDGVDFSIGDRILAVTDDALTGTYTDNWLKLDYTDAVLSVAGLTGAITASGLRAVLNVEDGATADQTDAEIKAAIINEGLAFGELSDAEAGEAQEGEIPVRRSGVWTYEAKPAGGSNPALADITDWPADVSATEVGYLDGVTSAIQTQLDAKADTSAIADMVVSDTTEAGGGTAYGNIVGITETEYDALSPPDPNTIYVRTGD